MYMNPERFDLFDADLNAGFTKAGGGKSLENYDLCPIVHGNQDRPADAVDRPGSLMVHPSLAVAAAGGARVSASPIKAISSFAMTV